MNNPDPRRRAKPELPHVGRSAVAATDVASCFALGTLVLLEDGSHAEVGTVAHMTRVRAAAKILLADRIFFMQVHGIFLI